MAEEKWMIYGKKADFDMYSKALGVSPILTRIMRNRDSETLDEQRSFLDTSLDKLYSPTLMKDMDKATDIIVGKIDEGKSIRIIGDYDIDGICSTFILVKGLERLGAKVSYDIPDRVKDGYGINEQIIKRAYDEGVDTIVTCDNGIAAIEQIAYAKELGMTVIVTDHHEIPYEDDIDSGERIYKRVNADATINPKQPDCCYPFKLLCGGVVAYKLVQNLFNKLNISDRDELLDQYLEFAAIATIGDVVDLIGENRIIAAQGLNRIRNTKNVGLDKLMSICGVNRERLSAYHIGFVVGPCLNATGRLETAKKGLALLLSDSDTEAESYAAELVELNNIRKQMTEEATEKGIMQAQEYTDDKVLVIYLSGVHESIAGIVAGRVREHYHKPVFILTDSADEDENNMIKGSGRSIEGYNMFEELIKCSHLLLRFGGHEMAAGLSLDKERLIEFRELINRNCTLTDEDLIKKVWIDVPMPIAYATKELVGELAVLEPFGKGNEKPVFATKNVKVKSLKIMGQNQNMCKLSVDDGSGKIVDALVFQSIFAGFMEFITDKFGEEQVRKAKMSITNDIELSLIYYPDINEYRGLESVQIIVNNYC